MRLQICADLFIAEVARDALLWRMATRLPGSYDPRMLSRRNWITEFTGYVLRRGLSDDPERVFDTAGELYPEWGELAPSFAADSAFSPEGKSHGNSAATKEVSGEGTSSVRLQSLRFAWVGFITGATAG